MAKTDMPANTRTMVEAAGATVMHGPITEDDNALKYDYPMFCEPMTADDFVAELRR